MKPFSHLRLALFAAWLPVVSASAQSPSPSATTIPASKPAAETSTPSPGAAVNTSTPAEKQTTVSKDILDRYDKNHDGVLDADERAAMDKDRAAHKAERLQKYDKNHDGKIDDSEREAMRADLAKKASADKAKTSPTP